MAFWLPMAAYAGMQGIGALIRGLTDKGDQWSQSDYGEAQRRAAEALANSQGSYKDEAVTAEGRLKAVTNPWVDSAIADQDYMRELQEGYTADLLAQAQGAKSYAREESARQEDMQRGLLGTMAASTRDRFAGAGARSTAMQEQAGLHQNMLLPTEGAAAAEKNAAQDMLTRVYGGQYQQDLTLEDLERMRRDQQDKIGLYGALAAFGHRRMGGQEGRAGAMDEVLWAQADATKKRND